MSLRASDILPAVLLEETAVLADVLELLAGQPDTIQWVIVEARGGALTAIHRQDPRLLDPPLWARRRALRDIPALLRPMAIVEIEGRESRDAAHRRRRKSPDAVMVAVRDGVPEGVFTDAVRSSQQPASDPGKTPLPELPPRSLIATVHNLEPPGPEIRRDGFESGAPHRVEIRVAPDLGGMGISTGEPFEIDQPQHGTTRACVVFDADWLEATVTRDLLIPPGNQPSDTVGIDFLVPDGLDEIALHVALVVFDRVIQTATLSGPVVDRGTQGVGITFSIDRSTGGIAVTGHRGLSLVLNDADRTTATTRRADRDEVSVCTMEGLGDYRGLLGGLVRSLQGSVQAIQSSGGDVEAVLGRDLRELAITGFRRDLLRAFEDRDEVVLAPEDGRPIQIVSRSVGSDLPLEFVYEGPVPRAEEPRLCRNNVAALNAGSCANCLGARVADGDICPFDFWGFGRTIERHVRDRSLSSAAAPFELRIGPAVGSGDLGDPIGATLFGMSDRFSVEEREAAERRLRVLSGHRPIYAQTWSDWVRIVGGAEGRPAETPTLLLALAHMAKEGRSPNAKLEINSSLLARGEIGARHVRPISDGGPGPIVLLVGCETSAPDIPFQSFVADFTECGAPIVVGTLAPIHKSLAVKASEALIATIDDLLAEQKSIRFGEAMRRARCRMLAKRDVGGLNLVAYGDAEWAISRRSSGSP